MVSGILREALKQQDAQAAVSGVLATILANGLMIFLVYQSAH
jgi:hypothetical protein